MKPPSLMIVVPERISIRFFCFFFPTVLTKRLRVFVKSSFQESPLQALNWRCGMWKCKSRWPQVIPRNWGPIIKIICGKFLIMILAILPNALLTGHYGFAWTGSKLCTCITLWGLHSFLGYRIWSNRRCNGKHSSNKEPCE